MKNIVAQIIRAKGESYFSDAWSPMLGEVNIDNVVGTGSHFKIFITSKADPNQKVTLNGDGKFYDGGEIMVYPEKGLDWCDVQWSPRETKPLGFYADDEMKKEIIKSTIENLDFERIHKTMKCLDWLWANIGGTPTIEQLEAYVKTNLEDLLNHDDENYYSIECGGFEFSFEISPPNCEEEDDFIHCVNVKTNFIVEGYSSMF